MLLLAATLSISSCTNDDAFGHLPEGSILLELGDVTVAGMKTGGHTRVAISENADGYTGIRKSTFVNGDALNLELSNDNGATVTNLTATLTGGAWVLSDKAYIIPGTTTIKATHAAKEAIAGIKLDALEAANYSSLTGQKVTFDMRHANSMIDITIPAGVTVTSITVAANNGLKDENLTTVVEEEKDGENHYHTIALPGTVKSITAVIHGQNYEATLAPPLTVESNKKYPVALTFNKNKLTATVGSGSIDWGEGETIIPDGYTRVIHTPEDLAQFAYDVNNDLNNARTAIVIQIADIDLGMLKPAVAPYSYTATASDWQPIGNQTNSFNGKYNGNGHSIINLSDTSNGTPAGLFGVVASAAGSTPALTGIYLRNCNITGTGNIVGALCASVTDAVISLCSATGEIYAGYDITGGLFGTVSNSHITRCNTAVNVFATRGGSDKSMGSFAGKGSQNVTAGCMSSGNLMFTSAAEETAGFIGYNHGSVIGCCNTGDLQKGFNTQAFSNNETQLISCYATTLAYDFNTFDAVADCAYAGATSLTGVTGNLTPDAMYAVLTKSNASLAGVKTLHWSKEDGYTLTEVTKTWYASEIWKDNAGAAPSIDYTYEGGAPLYNGQTPNLLAITGLTAYWVAPVNATNNAGEENMTWAEALNACPEGWHVPTKAEFEAMTGATESYTPAVEQVKAVFPAGKSYWTSTDAEDPAAAWIFTISPDNMLLNYTGKTENYTSVRCVRK